MWDLELTVSVSVAHEKKYTRTHVPILQLFLSLLQRKANWWMSRRQMLVINLHCTTSVQIISTSLTLWNNLLVLSRVPSLFFSACTFQNHIVMVLKKGKERARLTYSQLPKGPLRARVHKLLWFCRGVGAHTCFWQRQLVTNVDVKHSFPCHLMKYFIDAVFSAASVKTIHNVTGHNLGYWFRSVFCFLFTLPCMSTFPRQVHVVLLFQTTRHERDVT